MNENHGFSFAREGDYCTWTFSGRITAETIGDALEISEGLSERTIHLWDFSAADLPIGWTESIPLVHRARRKVVQPLRVAFVSNASNHQTLKLWVGLRTQAGVAMSLFKSLAEAKAWLDRPQEQDQ